jgi:hypothetical protein
MTAEAKQCPKCGAEARDAEHGNQQFACAAWVHVRSGRYFASQKCLERQISALTARVAELEGERERLREALLAADRDISEWLQLAKRQANELPNADYHPLAPTRLGIAASNEVRELIKSVFHVNIHGEVEYRET